VDLQISPGKDQISPRLRLIENNHGSGKVVISKESEQILVQSGSRIPSETILG